MTNFSWRKAKTLEQCIEHMKNGGFVWQTLSTTEDDHEYGGFDDIESLKENFPDGLSSVDEVWLEMN